MIFLSNFLVFFYKNIPFSFFGKRVKIKRFEVDKVD